MALESAFTLYATSFVGDASAFSPSSPMCVCVLACLLACLLALLALLWSKRQGEVQTGLHCLRLSGCSLTTEGGKENNGD